MIVKRAESSCRCDFLKEMLRIPRTKKKTKAEALRVTYMTMQGIKWSNWPKVGTYLWRIIAISLLLEQTVGEVEQLA